MNTLKEPIKSVELSDICIKTTYISLDEDMLFIEIKTTDGKFSIERSFSNNMKGQDEFDEFDKLITNEDEFFAAIGINHK